MAMLTNTKFVERRHHFTSVMMKGEDATPVPKRGELCRRLFVHSSEMRLVFR